MNTHVLFKKYFAFSFSLFLFFMSTGGLFLVPAIASAQNDLFPCSGGADNNISAGASSGGTATRACTFNDLIELAQAVANKIVQIGLLLSPFIFAYAGWLLLSSGANPGQRKKAQKIFLNVVIGLAIMLSAFLVVKLVLTALVDPQIYNNSAFPIQVNP